MGGIVALTIRWSNGEELRESCWTNILPKGLFGWKFFVKEESEKYAREFMTQILENRKKNKDAEELWGGWNKLAPVEYGQIIIDYMKKKVVHFQGYTGVDSDHVVGFDHGSMEKFLELHDRGLVMELSDKIKRVYDLEEDPTSKLLVDKVKRVYHWAKEYEHVSGSVALTIGGPPPKPEEKPPVDFKLTMYGIKSWIPIKGSDRDEVKRVYEYASKNFKLTKTEEKIWKKWLKEEK